MSIAVGSIVRRRGETRHYRLAGYRDCHAVAGHETVHLAIMEPIAESMVKRCHEVPQNLVEVDRINAR